MRPLSLLAFLLPALLAVTNGVPSSFQSGLLPVTRNSSLFYWYCPPSGPASRPPLSTNSTPLILWLQGGPGASGLIGLLYEMGPYRLEKDNASSSFSLVDRTVGAWSESYGMLFVDSPVGTGFSEVGGPDAYSRTEEDVAENLYVFLQGFYAMYPELLDGGLYIMGESYAGHYIPSLATYRLCVFCEAVEGERAKNIH
ncbi:hypothetical protein VYU27_010536 [Nannochloropsis oceanica]